MPPKKKKVIIEPKYISIREDQYDRLQALAKAEDRSMRSVLERLLDKYEGK